MKKYFLIATLLLFCACRNNKSSSAGKDNPSDTVINNNISNGIYKEYNAGVQLILENKVYALSKEDIEIKYQIKNIDNYQVSFGEGFDLEYWDGNNWIRYPITMNILSYQITVLKNHFTELKRLLPTNELKPGKYRMIVDVDVISEKDSPKYNFKLYSEFEIRQ